MDAAEALARAKLYTDEARYLPFSLPVGALTAAAGILAESRTPFSAVLFDKDEVTLILPEDEWDAFAHRLPDHRAGPPYRLITFDLPLDFELTGFMALVGRVLADADVPLLAFSAYSRDHVLVPEARFEAAWTALTAEQKRYVSG